VITSITVSARIPPGGRATDLYTVVKNGVDTDLTTSLTGSALKNVVRDISIPLSADDSLGVKVVTDTASMACDVSVVLELCASDNL